LTLGNDAIGWLGQSIGGGGGLGGASSAKTFSLAVSEEVPNITTSISVGGGGGNGGTASSVYFYNSGNISTYGGSAVGIQAQSVGGGGGHAGDATAGANSAGVSMFSIGVSASVGGNGGAGGTADTVGILNSGVVSTYGHSSQGILAQSIAGGGGNAGFGNAAQQSISPSENSFQAAVSVGGAGSSGGSGGTVAINNSGFIRTLGSGSVGVIGQSISGGGGNGGSAGAQGNSTGITSTVAVGGNGGGGAVGGSVNILNTGTILTGGLLSICPTAGCTTNTLNQNTNAINITLGGDSRGIVAQSVGGGGGSGGSADPNATLVPALGSMIASAGNTAIGYHEVYHWAGKINSSSESDSENPVPLSFNLTAGVGGSGGVGGNGGNVTVANAGLISTFGARADAILAQSVGGGGGIGGEAGTGVAFSLNGNINFRTPVPTFSANINVGGIGGSTGNGGVVSVYQNSSGSITTYGYQSNGVLAQSVGGGGGVAADGSAVNPYLLTGGSTTQSALSLGSLSTGSTASGTGNSVSIGTGAAAPFSGSITTLGDASAGILAQSIGGAGGIASGGCTNTFINGTTNQSLCLANQNSTQTAPAVVNTGNAQYAIYVYASGNSSSNGGDVQYYGDVTIRTSGTGSIGMLLQSVGGGGGVTLAQSANISAVGLPAVNQSFSSSGNVTMNLTAGGSITTSGAGAWGALLQSVAGGGGVLGDTSLSFTGDNNGVPEANTIIDGTSVASHTNTGTITAYVGGNIQTTGTNAHALFLQTVAGGGGIAGGPGSTPASTTASPLLMIGIGGSSSLPSVGTSGGIYVTQYSGSTISATGTGSVGIFAQSTSASKGSEQIVMTIGGTVVGNKAAIMISGGWPNPYYGVANSLTINAGAVVGNSNIVASANASGVITYTGSGVAIAQGSGALDVVNSGTVNGSFILTSRSSNAGEYYKYK